jgi:putative FmdB family regulatory protein
MPMPIYEYACPECQKEFEFLVRGQETPACPHCGGDQLEKQLSVPSAHRASAELTVCTPPGPGGCGLPQCGQGGCQML